MCFGHQLSLGEEAATSCFLSEYPQAAELHSKWPAGPMRVKVRCQREDSKLTEKSAFYLHGFVRKELVIGSVMELLSCIGEQHIFSA